MNQIPSISDAFRTVVAATEAAIIADMSINWGILPKKVYFMQGHPKELAGILQSLTNASLPKYPLIILIRDIEDQGASTGQEGINTDINARLVICMRTQAELRADDRETQNFKPILHPIFWKFITQITQSDVFNMPTIEDMKIKWTDRFFWGGSIENKNIFNDFIDAVEIKSIQLTVNNEHCNFSSNF